MTMELLRSLGPPIPHPLGQRCAIPVDGNVWFLPLTGAL
jgi:hypothetical protein